MPIALLLSMSKRPRMPSESCLLRPPLSSLYSGWSHCFCLGSIFGSFSLCARAWASIELLRFCIKFLWLVVFEFWIRGPKMPVWGSAYFDYLGEVMRNLPIYSGLIFWRPTVSLLMGWFSSKERSRALSELSTSSSSLNFLFFSIFFIFSTKISSLSFCASSLALLWKFYRSEMACALICSSLSKNCF